MIAFFVIFALIGVIIVQTIIYYREKLRLLDMIQNTRRCDGTLFSKEGKEKNDKNNVMSRGQRRAMTRWRNGGTDRGGDENI